MEWSVELMHWLLDVHFGENFCRSEDEGTKQVLNTVSKIALNCARLPLSKIIFSCLMGLLKTAASAAVRAKLIFVDGINIYLS